MISFSQSNYEFVDSEHFEWVDNRNLIKSNDKYGVANNKCKIIIEPIYDYLGLIHDFSDDLTLVKLKGKWGCVNKKGKIVVPIKYDKFVFYSHVHNEIIDGNKRSDYNDSIAHICDYLMDERSLAYVEINGKWGIIDHKGDFVVEAKYQVVFPTYEMPSHFWIKENGYWGIINMSGEIILPSIFTSTGEIMEGNNAEQYLIYINDKYGVINNKGEVLLPFEFYHIDDIDDLYFAYDNEEKVTVLDNKVGIITAGIFDDLSKFELCDGNWALAVSNGRYGVVDKSGELVVDTIYENIKPADNISLGSIWFQKDSLWGLIDRNGNILINPIYEEVLWASEKYMGGVSFVKNNGLCYILDDNLKTIKTDFDLIVPAEVINSDYNNYAFVRQQDKWGFVNNNLELVIPVDYEKLIGNEYRKGWLIYKSNDKFGFVDLSGDTISPPVYDDFYKWGEDKRNWGKVKVGEKVGFINKKGEVVVLPILDMAYSSGIFKRKLKAIVGWQEVSISDKGVLYGSDGERIMDVSLKGAKSE